MTKQLYYEDVAEGSELPTLIKRPDTKQLVRWAGASGDLNPIHYDKDYALKRELPGVVVHGQLAGCYLIQMITDFIGETGSLKSTKISYRGMNLPGDTLSCKGTINKKKEDGRVNLNLWVENSVGEKTLTASAAVLLPRKHK
jgi:acyl dehydratase